MSERRGLLRCRKCRKLALLNNEFLCDICCPKPVPVMPNGLPEAMRGFRVYPTRLAHPGKVAARIRDGKYIRRYGANIPQWSDADWGKKVGKNSGVNSAMSRCKNPRLRRKYQERLERNNEPVC